MPKPSDYFLSDADNAAIFEQQIRPAEFGDYGDGGEDDGEGEGEDRRGDVTTEATTHSRRRPVCIIMAGQTGAGKSHAAPALAAALDRAYRRRRSRSQGHDPEQQQPLPYCHLVADTHKPYHPAYAGLVADAAAGRVPPGLASAATGHDARRWLARACAVAAGSGTSDLGTPGSGTTTLTSGTPPPLPTLVESASRYPQDVVEMAGIFRRAGYRVCLVLLAVHAAQSRLGLLARFLDAKKDGKDGGDDDGGGSKKKLPVRLTPRPIHDESYAGLAELAALLDNDDGGGGGGSGGDDDEQREQQQPLADAVLILRRGNQVAYASYSGEGSDGDGDGGKREPRQQQVGRALEAERARRQEQPDDVESGGAHSSPLAAEAALFASDVARLRASHPERAAELDALAAEYAAAMAQQEGEGEGADEHHLGEPHHYPLNPDALVARLQSGW